jgi:DNA primase large subunit
VGSFDELHNIVFKSFNINIMIAGDVDYYDYIDLDFYGRKEMFFDLEHYNDKCIITIPFRTDDFYSRYLNKYLNELLHKCNNFENTYNAVKEFCIDYNNSWNIPIVDFDEVFNIDDYDVKEDFLDVRDERLVKISDEAVREIIELKINRKE